MMREKRAWWWWELGALVLSALTIVGLALFPAQFDGQRSPSLSLSTGSSDPAAIAARVTFNAILSLFGTASRFLMAVPLGKAIGQLMWVYYTGNDRKLADVAMFDAAGKASPKAAIQLVWLLRAK